MVKRILYFVSVILLTCAALVSCNEDVFSVWNEDGVVLSAYKERVTSRATAEYYFSEGTKYRIWVMEKDSHTSVFPGQEEGIEGTEAIREDGLHYIYLGEYDKKLVGEYDFYGLTDSTNAVPVPSSGENNLFDITIDAQTNDYVDYRRGALKYDERGTSSVLRMSFKHIMSQVKIKVMREEGVKSELKLKSVQFIGANTEETFMDENGVCINAQYNVLDNTFTSAESGIRTIKNEIPVPAVGSESTSHNDAANVGTFLFFPEDQNAVCYYMRVTFDDPDGLYGKGNEDAYVDIPILDNRETTDKALHFEPNTSYTLYITFLSNTTRIVTLVPQVYEWLDGEKDNGNAQDGFYQEQDLGQPVTFNGVMWSDRNLGATSAHPTRSMDDWNKSVGYFYQYGRNIPYFPNNLNDDGTVNYKTSLSDALAIDETFVDNWNITVKSGGFLYPVINYESWGTTAIDEKDKIAPADNVNKDYYIIRELGKGQNEPNRVWGIIHNQYNLGFINDEGWDRGLNTPCPPGWRLPTTDDFKGIIPGSAYSGNITFRRYKNIDKGSGSWTNENSNSEPNFMNIFSKDNIKYYTGFSGGPVGQGEIVYKGFFPCIFREEINDPEQGARSQYVLSMSGNDWNKVRDKYNFIRDSKDYVFNWGVIYGIKNVGTPFAYRVKWEVRLQSQSEPEEINGAWEYDTPFRGVLVISRYQTSKDDSFSSDVNGSYEHIIDDFDWEHPVEQLLLPIGGISDGWTDGRLANIGTESWYAISDRTGIATNYHKNIFWFKYCGTNTESQTAIISDKSLMVASVQVRCVRDLGKK